RGERGALAESNLVPADVRNLQPGRRKPVDPPLQEAEAPRALVLARSLEEQLHAQADAERGCRRGEPLGDQRVELELPEIRHRLRKGPYAGQDHSVGRAHGRVVARNDRICSNPGERLLDRAQIAHPVVEHGDARADRRAEAHRTPFVDGTPVSVSSIDTASRRARANALKHASSLWCALVPSSARRCSVSLALLATARKNSSAFSVSNPAIVGTARSASNEQKGRPLTSIAHAP